MVTPPREEGGSIGPLTHFFVTDGQKRDYLSRASQRARGTTKNLHTTTAFHITDDYSHPV